MSLHQRAIGLLKELSDESCQNDFVNQYGISLIERAESTLIVSNQEFDLEHIENEFDRLFTFVDKKHLSINGCAVLLSHLDENDESKNQVGVPVTKPFQDEQYSTIVVPKSKCISTIHYGDYYNLGYAYSSLTKLLSSHSPRKMQRDWTTKVLTSTTILETKLYLCQYMTMKMMMSHWK